MADKIPYMMVVLGDFNAKLNSWYANDNTTIEGWKIDFLTASFGFNQIINKPTHILNSSFSSCVDLIFTSQPNLRKIYKYIHHANCHHQITYGKFNLNVIYPPVYKKDVWYYKQADSDCIERAIANFDWEKAFHNVDVKKQVMLFNESFLIITEGRNCNIW